MTAPSSGGVSDPSSIDVKLVVPASEQFLELIRSVVGRSARMAGFTFDGIEDLVLAVNEAATLLMASSVGTVDLSVAGCDGHLDVAVEVDGGDEWPPAGLGETTGWQVLEVLCQRVSVMNDGRRGIALRQSIR